MKDKIDYKKQGKANREKGLRFERKVREDLESKGWVISKWQNNVEVSGVVYEQEKKKFNLKLVKGKCIPAKMGKFRSNQGGFPDFIAYGCGDHKKNIMWSDKSKDTSENYIVDYDVQFVEVKSNGYLSKEEKEKARWYLNNNYCSRFLIASKGKKRGEIKYVEFE